MITGYPKFMLRLEGCCVFFGCLFLYPLMTMSWTTFALLFFIPDLSLLAYFFSKKAGAIVYNTLHSYLLPLALSGLFWLYHLQDFQFITLIWVAHIGFDRALGFGLKYETGFKHTHLGLIGR